MNNCKIRLFPLWIFFAWSVVFQGTPAFASPPENEQRCRAAVLVYHHIGFAPPNAPPSARYVTTSPETFERHMQILREEGFTVVSYDQLADCLDGTASLPEKAAVITFDDGIASQYAKALPILEAYGYPATFFIVTGFIGNNRLLMSWDQIRDLHAKGFSIGSHTVFHPALTAVSPEKLRLELAESKQTIENQISAPITLFAYPFGYLNDTVATAVGEAGYRSARTILPGKDQYASKRFYVRITFAPDNPWAFRTSLKQ